MLVLTRKRYDSIQIGDNIEIKIIETGPRNVRIGIQAPPDVRIVRGELVIARKHSDLPECVEAPPSAVSPECDDSAVPSRGDSAPPAAHLATPVRDWRMRRVLKSAAALRWNAERKFGYAHHQAQYQPETDYGSDHYETERLAQRSPGVEVLSQPAG